MGKRLGDRSALIGAVGLVIFVLLGLFILPATCEGPKTEVTAAE